MRKLLIEMVVTCGTLGAAISPAHAICGQTSATTAEMDLFSIHGCDTEFLSATKKEANLSQSNWTNRGWDNANSCNILLEFPKFWNAWYLVTYGIQSVPDPIVCAPGQIICLDVRERPWHDGAKDYLELVRAGNSAFASRPEWHSPLEYKPKDDLEDLGRHDELYCPSTGFFLSDWVVSAGCGVGDMFGANFHEYIYLGCKAFDKEPSGDPPTYGASPTFRAATYVHESWHAWNSLRGHLAKKGKYGHEVVGPVTDTTCTQTACDHFYPHYHSAYKAGELYLAEKGGRPKLSVYQAQLENLCDLTDNAATWVPYSVRESAANDAGATAKERFVEKVPYWCGSTRPLWGMRPGGRPEWCADQNQRSCHGGCPNGEICGNDGCCIKQCPAGANCQCPSGSSCSANYTCTGSNHSCDRATGCCYYNVFN